MQAGSRMFASFSQEFLDPMGNHGGQNLASARERVVLSKISLSNGKLQGTASG